VERQAVRSCIMLAVQADSAELMIEGLADGGTLHPIQQAFRKHGLQCRFCTPGS
jgi:carbon-monoxide dehydrogenase small subunit